MADYVVEVTSITRVYVVNAESAEKAIEYAGNEVPMSEAIEVMAREVPEARQQARAKAMETKVEKATETEPEAQSRMKEPESDRSRRCAAISA